DIGRNDTLSVSPGTGCGCLLCILNGPSVGHMDVAEGSKGECARFLPCAAPRAVREIRCCISGLPRLPRSAPLPPPRKGAGQRACHSETLAVDIPLLGPSN